LDLEVYRDLPLEKKREFICQFEKNKGNLAWASSFSDSSKSFKAESSDTVDSWLNKSQILSLNGFKVKEFDTEEESDRLLKLIIEQSEQENDYKSETKFHPTEPRLHQYFYVQALGLKRSQGSEESSSLTQEAELNKQKLQGLLEAPPVDIKYEHEHILDLKQKVTVLNTAKVKLQTLILQAADQHADLKAKKLATVSATELAKEVTKQLEAGQSFLSELRDMVSILKRETFDEEGAKQVLLNIELLEQKACIHIDGIKMKLRQMKSCIA